MTDLPPESAHDEFLRLYRVGDLDGLVGLYENAAAIVAADGSTSTGKAAVREALGGLLALGGTLDLATRYAARSGDIALLSNTWRLHGTGTDGKALDLTGQTTEIVRQQPDGRWLYVVDHPWGGQ